jgi:hypothetical protein
MKAIPVKYLIALMLPFIFASCKTASMQMQILKPATLSIPKEIKQVGIVNRSLPAKGQGFNNFLEGFITGESVGADREGSQECMRGLAAGLNANPRFTAVLIEGVDLRGTGTAVWPEFLDWREVNDLCDRFRVDAIVALETFDSDISLRKGSREVERTINKKKVTVTEFYGDLRLVVRSGWTIYKPEGQQIIDRNAFFDEMEWNETGDSPENVISKFPSKRRAINESGNYSGRQYAMRISPTWITEGRSYFRKANDEFIEASKYVKKDNWKDAIAIWKRYTTNADQKIAGRANYNMALASEVEGNLSLALEWANRAWNEYGLKKARNYIQLLESRVRQQEMLNQQMEE